MPIRCVQYPHNRPYLWFVLLPLSLEVVSWVWLVWFSLCMIAPFESGILGVVGMIFVMYDCSLWEWYLGDKDGGGGN